MAKKRNSNPAEPIPGVVVTAATLCIAGSILAVPFAGFLPVLAVCGGILSAGVVIKALSEIDDGDEDKRKE